MDRLDLFGVWTTLSPATSAWGTLSHAQLVSTHIAAHALLVTPLVLSGRLRLWVHMEPPFEKPSSPEPQFLSRRQQ